MSNPTQPEPPRVTGGPPFKIPDPVGIAVRRLPLILVFGGLAAAAGAFLLYQLRSETFQTGTTLIVDGGTEPTVQGRERDRVPGDLGDYMRTLTARLQSVRIMIAAIEALPEEEWPEFLDPAAHPVKNALELMKRIDAREGGRNHLINISISAKSPDNLGRVLNVLCETLLDTMRKEQQARFSQRLEYLRAEQQKVRQRIEDEQARVVAMAAEVENKAFLHEGYDVHYRKLGEVQRLYWVAKDELLAAQADLIRAESNRSTMLATSLKPFADDRVMENFGINRIEMWTYEELQKLRASIDGLTPENPERQYVDMRMTSMEEYRERYKGKVNEDALRILEQTREYELDRDVTSARSRVEGLRERHDQLLADLRNAEVEASAVSGAIFNAFGSLQMIEQARERLKALSERIDDTELQAKSPLPVSVDEVAGDPGSPAASNATKLLMVGGMLGGGAVAFLLIAVDVLDSRIRSRSDLGRALGTAAAESIPVVHDDPEDPEFAGVCREFPESRAADALLRLADRIRREHERSGAKFFGVSAIEPGGGATTIAFNLASCLAGGGKRVVLVERCAGAIDLTAKAASISGLSLVRFSPEEAETSPNAFLCTAEEAAGDAELLVLDPGPVPADPIACQILRHCGGVLLVADEDVTLYQPLRRAVRYLIDAGVPAINACLNRSTALPIDTALHWIQYPIGLLTGFHRAVFRKAGLRGRRRRSVARS